MTARPRVVIVGGGFGGIAAAKSLRNTPVDITLVDRTNHFVFQPLLYQVASGALAPSDIAAPIRWLLRGQWNATVLMGDVTSVDPDAKAVRLADGSILPYEYLILAAGSRHAYFGHDEWELRAPGLKTLADAVEIRSRFLAAFENAESCPDPAERMARLTIVIVGGGPTGVELAGIMISIARMTLRREFRRVDPAAMRVILVEAGPRLLPSFREDLSDAALADLGELGVEVRLNTSVTGIEDGAVSTTTERIEARTVFWAAGNEASALSKAFPRVLDRGSHVGVEPDLSLRDHPEVFVIGDQASIRRADGTPVPRVAQGAMQMGRCAGHNIAADIRGEPRRAFRYVNLGDLAVIGRYRAVAQFPWTALRGTPAWLLWLFVHIMHLAGFRNRLSVLMQWGYAFFTWQRGVRLILRSPR